MTPYLDAGFLLTLLVPTDGSTIADRLLRTTTSLFPLNFLHQLQAENLLGGLQKSIEPRRQRAGWKGNDYGRTT
jgi:hypothetical protein